MKGFCLLFDELSSKKEDLESIPILIDQNVYRSVNFDANCSIVDVIKSNGEIVIVYQLISLLKRKIDEWLYQIGGL